MFNYSIQLQAFRDDEVVLPSPIRETLLARRAANRDRIIARQESYFPNAKISAESFVPQGSMAINTAVKKVFDAEEYDIDDGLVISRSQLVNAKGEELTADAARNTLCAMLGDARFVRAPTLMDNCARVFYATSDDEKHHVDIPIYREWNDGNGNHLEIASKDGWKESNPQQVTTWFRDLVEQRNKESAGWGTQTRQLVQLLKRFCRSRAEWLDLLPNGMKLTMLVAELSRAFDPRLDLAFYNLLTALSFRLLISKEVSNLAHPDEPKITRAVADENMVALKAKVDEALVALHSLTSNSNAATSDARAAWERVFNTDFFADFDNVTKSAAACADGTPRPPWPMALTCTVEVTAKVSSQPLENDTAVPKEVSIVFEAKVPAGVRGFDLHWQVVNTGEEAKAAKDTRGEFLQNGQAGHGGRYHRTESTRYHGRHWIEAFAVSDGKCIGRSGHFYVNIE